MEHLSGVINPSDDLTKALGWILHARQSRRSMGHYRIGSPDSTSMAPRLLAPTTRAGAIEAGEGVGAQSMGPVADALTAKVRDPEHVDGGLRVTK